MKSVEFLWYVFTQDGLTPSPDKVKALKKAELPESNEALRSFFRMVGWNQRFIERFSEMSAVMYDLVNEKGSFKWKHEHQQAFDAIKKSLTKETKLRYFEKGRKKAVLYMPERRHIKWVIEVECVLYCKEVSRCLVSNLFCKQEIDRWWVKIGANRAWSQGS